MAKLSFEPRARGLLHFIQSWGLLAIVGVLLVSLWVLIVVVSTTQRHRLIEDSRRELSQLNSAVAQHAAGLLARTETDLRTLDRWLQAHPGMNPHANLPFVALVNELREGSKGLVEPRLISRDGKIYGIPSRPGAAGIDVSDRSYFRRRQDPQARRLYVGEPVISRITGRWVLPVSLPLEAPVRNISMVAAAIDLTVLAALHEQMRLKPNGSILLMRNDGVVLARTPFEVSMLGRDLSGNPAFRTEIGDKLRGSFVSESAADGLIRLISFQRLEDFPVVVLVNRPLSDVLDVYNVRRDIVYSVAAVLTLLALGFTWVLFRSQRALRMAQQNLQRLEATDSLTGVMSRRAFLDAAQREFGRARRYGRPTAILVFDLDHFKHVNDRYGHAVGDIVLRDCAAAWTTLLRGQDLLGRIGGEEFCAVLPETSSQAAMQTAERLRRAVTLLTFEGRGEGFGVSVSVGIAMLGRGDEELSQTMERADRALYLAKERGRNRVETLEEARLTVVENNATGHIVADEHGAKKA